MNIGVIDCEFISGKGGKFPNLALMKISNYHKKKGDYVQLVGFDELNPISLFNNTQDRYYISKVFSKTQIPGYIKRGDNVFIGGSGFFYDHEHGLSDEIEHVKPDYSLYKGHESNEYFNKFSIGFTTRGCFRKCPFCINRNCDRVVRHSPVHEFLDTSRPFIMLLDDNITGFSGFYDIFDELNATGKPFIFKQGMDFRLLSLKKMRKIWDSNYYSGKTKSKGGRTFFYAFDDINDYDTINEKLNTYYSNIPYKHNLIFYVLAGFDRDNKYTDEFFEKDIRDTLKRIKLLFSYGAFAYVMLHENYKLSPYYDLLNDLKNVCNAPIHVAGKLFGDAILQSKYMKLYDWIESHEPQYLKLRQNIKSVTVN